MTPENASAARPGVATSQGQRTRTQATLARPRLQAVRGGGPRPPSDRRAELALCGAAIIDPAVLDRVAIEPEHFADGDLRRIWRAMRDLRRQGMAIDEVTLPAHAAVSAALVGECAAATFTASNVEHYASILHENRMARAVLSCTADILDMQRKGATGPELLAAFARHAHELEQSRPGAAAMLGPTEILRAMMATRDLPVTALGWPELDRALGGGIVAGQVAVLAAATGAGKTAFALQASARVAQSAPVIFASYEMPPDMLGARIVAQVHGCAWLDVRRGAVGPCDVARALPDRLRILDRPSLTELGRAVNALAQAEGMAPLVVVDYLQLVAHRVAATRPGTDLRAVTVQVSEHLRDLAASTGAPMLAISAVSRGGSTRARNARDLPPAELVDVGRESSAIEYDASAVIVLSVGDDEDDDGQEATVTVAKARFGRARHLNYRYAGAAGVWHEIGHVESTKRTAKLERLREAILASLECADGPLAKSAIIERGGTKHVKGRRADVWAAVDAMVRDGELIEVNGAYSLAMK